LVGDLISVMPGQKRVFALGDPGIHAFCCDQDADGRVKPGHDD
jgi:hypothetical protein